MSEAQTSLFPQFNGYVTVSCESDMGMITMRGSLTAKGLGAALGKSLPKKSLPKECMIVNGRDMQIAWMSPDELLVLCPKGNVADLMTAFEGSLSTQHALVCDVSDARAVFTLQGANVREVVAKLAPVDIAPGQFGSGEMRRTRFGQIAAAFWMTGEDELKIICFRSVAEYMYKQLCLCAKQGSELDLWT